MVSTLDILKKEKELVDKINHCDRCIIVMISQLEDAKSYPRLRDACSRYWCSGVND